MEDKKVKNLRFDFFFEISNLLRIYEDHNLGYDNPNRDNWDPVLHACEDLFQKWVIKNEGKFQ